MSRNSTTSDFIFNVWEIVRYTCQFMTLLLGDVISPDTSAGIVLGLTAQRFLRLGGIIDSDIDGLGKTHPVSPSLYP
ncbi:MAG: fumarylacetoacetate hydrolase family protein [Rhodothermaceae bacterium]|nr:fumarylacetoacetate hydrolase family protein [Rhodothermaceae bacterium]MXW32525.1 fumarylacetoacetate hydrolase family protein [Rhodothermaceae bacterium]MXZ18398.1 fumarylacetoacetate hydrolase family protein [Rhodothermaceae bacterium]MYC03839.1 fumarylacetoacetate hydrolase family protein [Rhodothermaceae bacterium]MYE62425.1 fumarylacetoacetate hydrolase family protein [Rhodothermaceae bacterium]